MTSGTRMAVTVAKGLSSTVTLNDGVVMPLFGLGMYKMGDKGVPTGKFALQHGYRLLDTAEFYRNEGDTAEAVRQSGVPRKDVFVVSKVWESGSDVVKNSFTNCMKQMKLDYLDLYLSHSPGEGKVIETYKAMLEFKEQGLVRSVGVSNYGVQHLEGIKKAGLPTPSVNQIELHPWQQKTDIVKYCRENNIAVMGWSPLTKGQLLNDPALTAIAKKYGKSNAQILIRWSVQHGYITIPKTSQEQRVIENAEVFDWEISEEDMKTLNSFPDESCSWDPTTRPFTG